MAQSPVNSMLNFFKIGYSRTANEITKRIFPTKLKVDDKGKPQFDKNKNQISMRDVFPPLVDEYFKKWLSNTHDSAESWKNREMLWKDMDMLYFNSPLVSRAIEIVADEVIQADSNEQPIIVEAKRGLKKEILEFFDRVGLYDKLRPTVVDIVQYGNALWTLSFDKNGVDEIIPTNIYQLRDRLEFSPYKVQEMMGINNSFLVSYASKVTRIQQLIDMIQEDKDNIASYFKNYLFGYQIGEYVVPPWRALHFRNLTTKSPFDPFGIPVFIHSIAPYRQFDFAMTMQIAARGARFPKDLYKMNFPNTMSESEKLSKCLEFVNEYQNSGINGIRKETDGIGEMIVTIKDLFEYEQIQPNIDLGKIDDLDMLRDDIILSTFLPRYMIDPRDSGFGDSGVALVQKFKPFARLVYRIQNIILQNVSQLVKIHLLHSGKYSLEDLEFTLSMPYPESQTDTNIINSQKDLLDLANSVVDALGEKFMGGEKIPMEVIRDIYHKILPYDQATIDLWIKQIEKDLKQKENDQEEMGGSSDEMNQDDMSSEDTGEEIPAEEDVPEEEVNPDEFDGSEHEFQIPVSESNVIRKVVRIKELLRKQKWYKLEEKIGKINLKEQIAEEILMHKQERYKEGSLGGKHYFSSRNVYTEFPAELMRELDVRSVKNIKTSNEGKPLSKMAEEFKYHFSYDTESKEQERIKEEEDDN